MVASPALRPSLSDEEMHRSHCLSRRQMHQAEKPSQRDSILALHQFHPRPLRVGQRKGRSLIIASNTFHLLSGPTRDHLRHVLLLHCNHPNNLEALRELAQLLQLAPNAVRHHHQRLRSWDLVNSPVRILKRGTLHRELRAQEHSLAFSRRVPPRKTAQLNMADSSLLSNSRPHKGHGLPLNSRAASLMDHLLSTKETT